MFRTRAARVARATRPSRHKPDRARGELGQTLVEYALIIAVVSLGAVAALTFLRDEITSVFSDSGSALSEAGAAGGTPPPPAPTAPGTPALAGGPGQGSAGTSPPHTSGSFTFTGDGTQTSFECSLDMGPFTTCTSPRAYSTPAAGAHSFRVQATNAGGSSVPATRNWMVGTATTPGSADVDIDCPGPTCEDDEVATAVLSGTWGGSPAPTSITYQWATHPNPFENCATAGGWTNLGTASTQTLPDADGLSDRVRVIVTATNGIGAPASIRACTSFLD